MTTTDGPADQGLALDASSRRARRPRSISSGAGRSYSATGIQAYASAKAGLIGFTRQRARELGRHGIRVNSVAPGFIRSNPAMGRTGVDGGQWMLAGRALHRWPCLARCCEERGT